MRVSYRRKKKRVRVNFCVLRTVFLQFSFTDDRKRGGKEGAGSKALTGPAGRRTVWRDFLPVIQASEGAAPGAQDKDEHGSCAIIRAFEHSHPLFKKGEKKRGIKGRAETNSLKDAVVHR